MRPRQPQPPQADPSTVESSPAFVRRVDRYGRVHLVPLGFALSPLEDAAFEAAAAEPCTSFTIH